MTNQNPKPQPQLNIIPATNWQNAAVIPYSQDSEDAVLGCILINPNSYYDAIQVLQADDFFILRNQYVFRSIQAIADRNEKIDYLTVTEELRRNGKLAEIGGMAYLTQLCNATPDSTNTVVYAYLVQRTGIRRQLMSYADTVKKLAMDETKEVSQIISEIEEQQINIAARSIGTNTQTLHAAVSGYYDRIESLTDNPNQPIGVPSGFKDLDHLTMGFDNQSFTLIGARPGMGKTSFMLTAALNMAKAGRRVAFFSLEMGVDQLTGRLIAMEAGINLQTLRRGLLNTDERARFVKAAGTLESLPLLIDDSTVWTPLQLHAKCNSLRRRSGIEVIFIDYVGLMSGGGRYKDNKVQEAGFISRSLKGMARDLRIPVIGAIQLSRAVEQRQDKRPILSDLRESGDWEQDADNVMFIYRDEVYNAATEFPNQADIIVSKQRNGPTGTIALYFEKTQTKFMNAKSNLVQLHKYDLGGNDE